MTDGGLSALGRGCGQLQSINLSNCHKVTDAGVSALVAGCGQLQSINLSGCYEVTDAGVSALEYIWELKGIVLRWCGKATDAAGVSVLSCGCGKLQSIDLSNCSNITDAGVSALGRGCGQLQSINLTR